MHNLETSQCDVSTEERESENSPALLYKYSESGRVRGKSGKKIKK